MGIVILIIFGKVRQGVTPGFINAHCHMSMPCTVSGLGQGLARSLTRQIERNAEECIKHGVTTVRDMAAISYWVHVLKNKISDGQVVGQRIITSFLLDVSNGYLGGIQHKQFFFTAGDNN